MKNKNTLSLVLIFLTVFIDLLGFGVLIPLLPTFATHMLHIDETAIGIAIALYSFTQFIFNPILGKLSDKHGRRPVILICLLLNATGYVIFAFTNSYLMLLLSRFIAGIGGSSIGVAQAYIADVTTVENRSKGMSIIGAGFALGFVFGPLTGGWLSNYGYMVTGLASASFSLTAFLLTLILLPESLDRTKTLVHRAKKKLIDLKAFEKLFTNKGLAISVILFFILTFSNANMFGTFALLGNKIYGFSDLQNGYCYAIIGLTSIVAQGSLAIGAKRFNDKKLITAGSLFMTLGLGFMPFGHSFGQMAIILIVLSMGTGLLQPVLLGSVSKTSSQTEQGVILGLNQSFAALARVLGPLWGGFSFEYLGYVFPFVTGSFFAFLILLTSIFVLSKYLKPVVEDDVVI